MLLVFFFALAGISVASDKVEYHTHTWLPIILILLSSAVIISTLIRLVKRYRYRHSKGLDF
jgi:uncharacterized integral membrane protein